MEAVDIFLVSSGEDVGDREGQRSYVECVEKMVCRSLGWKLILESVIIRISK